MYKRLHPLDGGLSACPPPQCAPSCSRAPSSVTRASQSLTMCTSSSSTPCPSSAATPPAATSETNASGAHRQRSGVGSQATAQQAKQGRHRLCPASGCLQTFDTIAKPGWHKVTGLELLLVRVRVCISSAAYGMWPAPGLAGTSSLSSRRRARLWTGSASRCRRTQTRYGCMTYRTMPAVFFKVALPGHHCLLTPP